MRIELYQDTHGWTAEIISGLERIKIETMYDGKYSESYVYNRIKNLNSKAMIVFKAAPLSL